MEETRSIFRKTVFINIFWIFIALPKFYATHRNYEILSKSLVPIEQVGHPPPGQQGAQPSGVTQHLVEGEHHKVGLHQTQV